MKIILIPIAIVIVWLLFWFVTLTHAQQIEDRHAYLMPGKIAAEWHFIDEYRVWLSINSADNQSWRTEGFNPSFTNVISTYKPIVKKLPNGQYEITFTSEIAADLP